MKKSRLNRLFRLCLIILCVLAITLMSACSTKGIKEKNEREAMEEEFLDKASENKKEPKPAKLGVLQKVSNPGLERYPEGEQDNFARSVWDMQVYDGKVYFGSGDYEANKSPTYIGCYDPKTNEAYIFQSGIADEQIDRFCIIDGRLLAPGIDPSESWVMHYYELNDDQTAFECISMPSNGNLHNFDIAYFDGKMFLATGTNENKTVAGALVSTDGGENFAAVEVINGDTVVNGQNVGGFSRVYDYFEVGGNLYALFFQHSNTDGKNYNGIYKYDADKNQFVYHSSEDIFKEARAYAYYGEDNINGYLHYGYAKDSVSIGNKLAICNGYLLVTEDMKDYTRIEPKKNLVFTDIIKSGDTVFALAMRQNGEDDFTNFVYKSTDLESFTEVAKFDSATYMRSMEYIDGMFVFGAGTRVHSTASKDSGTIYRMKVNV